MKHRCLAVTAALALVIVALPSAPPAEAAGPVITVTGERYRTSDGRLVDPIPATIVGANHRWPDDGKGMWDPATNRPVGGIDDLARTTGLGAVRYPGGTVANFFDFSRAIGPQSERGCQTSGGFANGLFAPTDSRYGPDEQEQFVHDIGAETMIMVPSINRTAADAADYVEYMNSPADGAAGNPNGGVDWAERRAANGHPEPYAIKVWEYGNEPYLANQRYWRADDLRTRARQFVEGGWQRQTADSLGYQDNDGLFTGCDLEHRRQGTGEPDQSYRTRYAPIALPGDENGAPGVGDGPVQAPVLTVDGDRWQLVDDLGTAGPDDGVYAIDQDNGTVHFGDGVHGQIPAAGARLSIEYTTGVQEGFLAFAKAMKAVDPSISVCAGWGKTEFIDAIGSRPYDCLGVHSYTTPPDDGTPWRYHNLQYSGGIKSRELADFRTRMAGYFPDPAQRPELIVTEYGNLNVPIKHFGATLANNLYQADLVAGQLENNVGVSTTSNLNGLGPTDPADRTFGELFGLLPTFIDTGRARMLSLYSRMVGGTLVRTEIDQNPLLASGLGDYDALRVVSAREGSTVRVMIINRDPDTALTSRVVLPGNGGGQLTVSTLNGPDVGSYNSDTDPDAVTITTHRRTTDSATIRHTVAAHSVTLIELRR